MPAAFPDNKHHKSLTSMLQSQPHAALASHAVHTESEPSQPAQPPANITLCHRSQIQTSLKENLSAHQHSLLQWVCLYLSAHQHSCCRGPMFSVALQAGTPCVPWVCWCCGISCGSAVVEGSAALRAGSACLLWWTLLLLKVCVINGSVGSVRPGQLMVQQETAEQQGRSRSQLIRLWCNSSCRACSVAQEPHVKLKSTWMKQCMASQTF